MYAREGRVPGPTRQDLGPLRSYGMPGSKCPLQVFSWALLQMKSAIPSLSQQVWDAFTLMSKFH